MPAEIEKEIFDRLAEKGYVVRMLSAERLGELKDEIEGRHDQGLFDEEFYSERLTSFVIEPPADLARARSVVVIAAPQPHFNIYFDWHGKRRRYYIPSTYLYYPNREAEGILTPFLNSQGYHLARSSVPLKLLAVRSGLGRYGKNNVCYIEGLGSFNRLMAFYTDVPCSHDDWQESRIMEECQKCMACIRGCPTGAISSDRFLLHAERCLTYWNERRGEFPGWIDPAWHHALVGCLYCQNACPKNKDLINRYVDKCSFSEEETDLLLKATPFDQLPEATAGKLTGIDWTEDLDILARNLNVLLKQSS
ncbi:epoxyqueuosine reductase [candidate division WOR-3 bacterium]|nr:epoxyqueuosine reductase [candidate division WOR-3 bacterium]